MRCGHEAATYYRVWDPMRGESRFLCPACVSDHAVVVHCEACRGAGLVLMPPSPDAFRAVVQYLVTWQVHQDPNFDTTAMRELAAAAGLEFP